MKPVAFTYEGFNLLYFPYSNDLKHPGDRRRICILLKNKALEVLRHDPDVSSVNLIILSQNVNFFRVKRRYPEARIFLDVLDNYAQRVSLPMDFLRNLYKWLGGSANLFAFTYSNFFQKTLSKVDLVITPSLATKDYLDKKGIEVVLIPDDFSEYSQVLTDKQEHQHSCNHEKHLFWDGNPEMLKHFLSIKRPLEKSLINGDVGLFLVTGPNLRMRFRTIRTAKFLNDALPNLINHIHLVGWSLENVIRYAKLSIGALVPVDTNVHLGSFKSDNKLRCYDSLGLPIIASDIYSYRNYIGVNSRVMIAGDCDSWELLINRLISESNKGSNLSPSTEFFRNFLDIQRSERIDDWLALIKRYLV